MLVCWGSCQIHCRHFTALSRAWGPNGIFTGEHDTIRPSDIPGGGLMLQSWLPFSLRLFSFSSLQVWVSILCIGVHECSYLCGSICVCRCAHSHVGGLCVHAQGWCWVFLHCFSTLFIEAKALYQTQSSQIGLVSLGSLLWGAFISTFWGLN